MVRWTRLRNVGWTAIETTFPRALATSPSGVDAPLELTQAVQLAQVVVAARQMEQQIANGGHAEARKRPFQDSDRREPALSDRCIEELGGSERSEQPLGRLRRASRDELGVAPPTLPDRDQVRVEAAGRHGRRPPRRAGGPP